MMWKTSPLRLLNSFNDKHIIKKPGSCDPGFFFDLLANLAVHELLHGHAEDIVHHIAVAVCVE